MARKKSEFLGALGTTFQIFKTIADTVMEEGGSDDDLRRVLNDKDLAKNLALLFVGKAPGVVEKIENRNGVFEAVNGLVVRYMPISQDDPEIHLGKRVLAKGEGHAPVPKGTKGCVISIHPEAGYCDTLTVLFDGHCAGCCGAADLNDAN